MSSIELLEDSRLCLQEFHARELRLWRNKVKLLTHDLHLSQEKNTKLIENNSRIEKENRNCEKILQQKDEHNQMLLLQIQILESEMMKKVSDPSDD
jgi:hypothetical protein